MKNLTLLFCLMVFSTVSFGQQSIDKFYKQFKKESNARSVSVPGLFIKIGAALSKKNVEDDPVAEMGLDLAKKIKGMKVLMVDDYYPSDSSISNFLDNAHNKSGMEDLFMMKAAGSDIHFMMKDDGGDIIKNLVILIADDEGLMLMNMKSKLSKKEIGQLINMAIQQEREGEEKEEKEEEKPVVVGPRA